MNKEDLDLHLPVQLGDGKLARTFWRRRWLRDQHPGSTSYLFNPSTMETGEQLNGACIGYMIGCKQYVFSMSSLLSALLNDLLHLLGVLGCCREVVRAVLGDDQVVLNSVQQRQISIRPFYTMYTNKSQSTYLTPPTSQYFSSTSALMYLLCLGSFKNGSMIKLQK